MNRGRDNLPTAVYTSAQIRDFDRTAIAAYGIPGYELMCRAGAAAMAALGARWPEARTIAVLCGAGNNAGDGYVVARLAKAAGFAVRVYSVVAPERLHGDAARALDACRAAGVEIVPFDADRARTLAADVIVDALLGTGLDRPVEGAFGRAIAAVNAAGSPVLALDIPSGLDADTGRVLGAAVRADATVTFVGLKQGLFLGDAPDYRGELELADLALPAAIAADVQPALERLHPSLLAHALPRRSRSSHKGANGRVLLVGGGPGMSGAIRLAAEAALRVGAGLVYVATHADSVVPVSCGRPELMCRAVDTPEGLDPLLDVADVVVAGPGLGTSAWAGGLLERVLDTDLPLLVDADGLNLLAARPAQRANWLLTPHPGEASRLLGCEIGMVQSDRLAAVRALAERYAAVAVLKGACSLISAPARPVAVCDYGNPGMATGGTGDVLSGVLGGLAAQCRDLALAARAGVLLHAIAGDDAAREGGERGMAAGDLMPAIRRRANPV